MHGFAGMNSVFEKHGFPEAELESMSQGLVEVIEQAGNDPTDKYKLKSLPGKFTGLHLLAIMFAAFRQIDPTMETGADFNAEYDAALQIQEKQS